MKSSKEFLKKSIILLILFLIMISFYNLFLDMDKNVTFSVFDQGSKEKILSESNDIQQNFKIDNDEIDSINLYPSESKKLKDYSFHYQIFNENKLLTESDINLEGISTETPINVVLPQKLSRVKNDKLRIKISTNCNESIGFKTDEKNRLSLDILSGENSIIIIVFKKIFIFMILFVCLIYFLLFYLQISYKKIFVLSLLVVGMIMNFLIPIGNVPDEVNAHMITVYHYSNEILGIKDNPKNVKIRKCDGKLFQYAVIDTNKMIKYINDLQEKNTNNKLKNSKLEILNTKGFSFTYYLSAIGVSLGRILNFNGIWCMLIGRFTNYLLFVLCSYFALSILKTYKELLVLFCFLPITIQQACSLSYDSNVISLAILIFALSVKLFNDNYLNKKDFLLLVCCSILIIPCKNFAYVPLLLIPFSHLLGKIKKNYYENHINKKIVLLIFLMLTIFSLVIFIFIRKKVVISSILYLVVHPNLFAKVIRQTLYYELNGMINSSIGSPLGLLRIEIYKPIMYVYIVLFTYIILNSKSSKCISCKIKSIWIFAFIVSFVGILLASYTWTYTWKLIDLSSTFVIRGFQGRYILPLVLPLGASLCNSKNISNMKIQSIVFVNVYLLFFSFASIMIYLV